jgi:hypothetical protein
VGVEHQEVENVRNQWTGCFESFEQPRFVEQIERQR